MHIEPVNTTPSNQPPAHLLELIRLLKGRTEPLPFHARPPIGPDTWGVADARYRLATKLPMRAAVVLALQAMEPSLQHGAARRGSEWAHAAAIDAGRWAGVVEYDLCTWLGGVADGLQIVADRERVAERERAARALG